SSPASPSALFLNSRNEVVRLPTISKRERGRDRLGPGTGTVTSDVARGRGCAAITDVSPYSVKSSLIRDSSRCRARTASFSSRWVRIWREAAEPIRVVLLQDGADVSELVLDGVGRARGDQGIQFADDLRLGEPFAAQLPLEHGEVGCDRCLDLE